MSQNKTCECIFVYDERDVICRRYRSAERLKIVRFGRQNEQLSFNAWVSYDIV